MAGGDQVTKPGSFLGMKVKGASSARKVKSRLAFRRPVTAGTVVSSKQGRAVLEVKRCRWVRCVTMPLERRMNRSEQNGRESKEWFGKNRMFR